MDTVHGREAVRTLRDLLVQMHEGGLVASEFHRNTQEVESCYSPEGRAHYVPRVRVTMRLHRVPPTAQSGEAQRALQCAVDLSAQGTLRNVGITVDPCEGDDDCGMRLSLWYDDESASILAMCA